MWYFDTNILIYSIASIDESKMLHSQKLINQSIKNRNFLISPLTIQELIFVLAKLKIEKQTLKSSVHSFLKYCKCDVDAELTGEAFDLCERIDFCKNINDAIHLKFAEKHCEKLLTFDKDFNRFKEHTQLELEILEA